MNNNNSHTEHLYIVGNGFDRHHGAKSTYEDFRKYLLRRNDFVVKMFELFFGPRSMMNSFDSFYDYLLCLQCSWKQSMMCPENIFFIFMVIEDYTWQDYSRESFKYLNKFEGKRTN